MTTIPTFIDDHPEYKILEWSESNTEIHLHVESITPITASIPTMISGKNVRVMQVT